MNKEYSPLVKVFNKRLEEEDKKEGLLKRLKNVEGKNEEQLKVIKDQGQKELKIIKNKTKKGANFKNIAFKSKLSFESKKVFNEIEKQNEKID